MYCSVGVVSITSVCVVFGLNKINYQECSSAVITLLVLLLPRARVRSKG